MGLHEVMLGCRICAAADGDALEGVSREENETHEVQHVPPSTAHYLRSTGRVVRLSPGNRWVEREAYVNHAGVRVEPSGHLTSCEPGGYDSECAACRESLGYGVEPGELFIPVPVGEGGLSADGAFRFAPEDASAPDDCDCEDCKADEDAFQPWWPDEGDFAEPGGERITDEAYRLVMGDRQSDYNHPSDDFKATGRQWGAILTNWLHSEGYVLHCCANTGEGHEADVPDVEPRIVALMMAQLKLSRESHKPKHDNRVDAIGYVLCADRIVEDY